jgi:hypothetical protein
MLAANMTRGGLRQDGKRLHICACKVEGQCASVGFTHFGHSLGHTQHPAKHEVYVHVIWMEVQEACGQWSF